MDAEYLKQNVGDILANGLTAVVLNQPEDSVDFLGRWLLNFVQNKRSSEAAAKAEATQAEIDAKAAAAAKAKADAEAQAKAATEQAMADKIKELEEFLAAASTLDGLQETYLDKLSKITATPSMYIGQKKSAAGAGGGGEGEEGEGAPTDELKYVAATPSHEFLLGKCLPGDKGVTFQIFAEQAAEGGEEGGEEGEEGEEKKEAAPVETNPSVYVPNVMMGEGADKMHFWQLPNTGSYMSIKVAYESCVNDATFDFVEENEAALLEKKAAEEEEARQKAEAEAEEEARLKAEAAAAEAAEAAEGGEQEENEDGAAEAKEEKEEEPPVEETEEEKAARLEKEAKENAESCELYLIAAVPKTKVEYALCLDTLGSGTRLTTEQMDLVKKFAKLFQETLERVDRAVFSAERLKRKNQTELDAATEEPSEEDITSEKEKLAAALERQGLPNTEEDVNFKYLQGHVDSLREHIAEFRTYNVFKGHTEVVYALLYLLDHKKEALQGPDGEMSWKKTRMCFNDELFVALSSYDPREVQTRPKSQNYATVKGLEKLLGGLDKETVYKRNKKVGAMYDYVHAALAVKNKAKAERIEAKRVAAEEAAAAAEAAKLAAEEEAARLAAEAEGGEATEGGEAAGGEAAAE